jgi:hypothetical protein
MFALDETEQDAIFRLLAEVRELRGIAEAARELPQRVMQTAFGDPDGNCFEACLASITGMPLADLPHFLEDGWFGDYDNWLRERGWGLIHFGPAKDVPAGFAIASGPAPRGIMHSAVYRDGVLEHDPHPSGDGLEVRYWMLVHALARYDAGVTP